MRALTKDKGNNGKQRRSVSALCACVCVHICIFFLFFKVCCVHMTTGGRGGTHWGDETRQKWMVCDRCKRGQPRLEKKTTKNSMQMKDERSSWRQMEKKKKKGGGGTEGLTLPFHRFENLHVSFRRRCFGCICSLCASPLDKHITVA